MTDDTCVALTVEHILDRVRGTNDEECDPVWAIHYRDLVVNEGRLLGKKGDTCYALLPDGRDSSVKVRRIKENSVYDSEEEAKKALFMHKLKRGKKE